MVAHGAREKAVQESPLPLEAKLAIDHIAPVQYSHVDRSPELCEAQRGAEALRKEDRQNTGAHKGAQCAGRLPGADE